MNRKLLVAILIACVPFLADAQYFTSTPNKTIPGFSQTVYDTLMVSSVTPAMMDSAYGLSNVKVNLTYSYDPDLQISIIAPDGTIVHLADNQGDGADYANTKFSMAVNNLVDDAGSPFNGVYRPQEWLGKVNNGQMANGPWVLRIQNSYDGDDTGTLISWRLSFNNTPAPPAFFDSSTLPIVVVNTGDVPIQTYSDDQVPAMMGIIDNGTGQVNHMADPLNGYNGHIGIHVRGSSSRSFAQKSYSVETHDSVGANLNVPILNMPSDNDWILYAPYDDKSLVRDVITYQLSNDMGPYAPRTRLCELVLNGDYKGVYVMEEKIKKSSQRVDISTLNTADTTGSELTGGYIFEVDRGYNPGYDCFVSNYHPCDDPANNVYCVYTYPKKDDINDPQKSYIASYTDSFETALKTVDMYDTANGYRKYIDVASFIDQALLQEMGRNVDGYRLSSYLHKKKDGKLFGGPIWDFNLAFGNADYYNGWETSGFEWDLGCPDGGNNNPFWWQQFLTDTDYVKDLHCRYSNLRTAGAVFDSVHIYHMVDSLATMLQAPQQRHYMRWPILGTYVWPNYFVGNTYGEEVGYLKGWIGQRLTWLDSQLYNPGCIDTTTPITTAIVSVAADAKIQVYPNPSADEVTVSSNAAIDNMTVYNAVGQKVYGHTGSFTRFTFSTRRLHLASGLYNVVLHTMQGMVRKKIVISG